MQTICNFRRLVSAWRSLWWEIDSYTLTQMPIFLTCRSRTREVDRITVDILVINISRFNSLFKKRTIFQTVPRKAYAVNCELLHHQNYLGYRFLNRWATTQASIIVLPILNGGPWWSSGIVLHPIPQTTHHSASGHQNTLRSTHQQFISDTKTPYVARTNIDFRFLSVVCAWPTTQCSLQQDGESLERWYF